MSEPEVVVVPPQPRDDLFQTSSDHVRLVMIWEKLKTIERLIRDVRNK